MSQLKKISETITSTPIHLVASMDGGGALVSQPMTMQDDSDSANPKELHYIAAKSSTLVKICVKAATKSMYL